jgi:hypothetical protein
VEKNRTGKSWAGRLCGAVRRENLPVLNLPVTFFILSVCIRVHLQLNPLSRLSFLVYDFFVSFLSDQVVNGTSAQIRAIRGFHLSMDGGSGLSGVRT